MPARPHLLADIQQCKALLSLLHEKMQRLEAELLAEERDETPAFIPSTAAKGAETTAFSSLPSAQRSETSSFVPSRFAERDETTAFTPSGNEEGIKADALFPPPSNQGMKTSVFDPSGNEQGMKASVFTPPGNPQGTKADAFIPSGNEQDIKATAQGASPTGQGTKAAALVPPAADEVVNPSAPPNRVLLMGQLKAGEPTLRFRDAAWAAADTIIHIMKQPGGNGQREMAKVLGYSASGVAKHMSRMQRLGLIVRLSYQRYGLTEKSRRYAAAAAGM